MTVAGDGASRRVTIVTGASRGLGRAAAYELARDGYAVALAARSLDACEEAAGEIREQGGEALAVQLDVADRESVRNAVEGVLARWGKIDVLVNNAGVVEPIGMLGELDEEAWAQNIGINLLGPFNALQAVLPTMKRNGGGTIINVSSGAAHRAIEGWSAYCSAKAGLAMLTASIATELAGEGIFVYALSPGTVDTEMQAVIRASGINPVSQIPREALTPVQIPARAIARLANIRSPELNGEEFRPDDPRLGE